MNDTVKSMKTLLAVLLAVPVAAQAPAASDPTAFALALHKRAAAARPGTNLMLSPYSARQAFGMALAGAAGKTRSEMAAVLGAGPSFEDEERAQREAMAADKEVTLRIANALFLKEGYPFLKSYVDRVKAAFAAEVFVRAFGPATVNELNGWASKQTEGKIPTILKELGQGDRAVLLNAVYFKGKWRTAFPKKAARSGGPLPETFRPTGAKPYPLELMSVSDTFDYAETPGWQAVRLPYRGGRLAMLVVLPAEASSLGALRDGLDSAAWRDLRGALARRKGLAAIPRFKFEGDYDLIPPLKESGMRLAFDKERADFSGISKPGRREDELYLTKAVQKTFVAVDEEGTEAAAVTAVVAGVRGVAMHEGPPPFRFIANRPFLFAIEDARTGCILFLGEVHDPKK